MKATLKQLLLDAILAVLIFTQITGCAATAGLTPAELEIINDPNRSRVFVPASDQIITNAKIPSLKGLRHFIYNVTGTIEWSNGYQDKFNRFGQFYEREKQYVLLAVELNPSQESKDVTFKVTSLGTELVLSPRPQPADLPALLKWDRSAQAGVAVGLFPLLVLLFPFLELGKYIAAKTERPETERRERPFDGCCFVWLADVETGETIAGEAPEGAKIVFSESIRSATPSVVPGSAN